jgi:hypothetical protein
MVTRSLIHVHYPLPIRFEAYNRFHILNTPYLNLVTYVAWIEPFQGMHDPTFMPDTTSYGTKLIRKGSVKHSVCFLTFCWPCIIMYHYNVTNLIHILDVFILSRVWVCSPVTKGNKDCKVADLLPYHPFLCIFCTGADYSCLKLVMRIFHQFIAITKFVIVL